jgi:8-oxo-dGTP pyrophosphatase MutT (NUDIX family)
MSTESERPKAVSILFVNGNGEVLAVSRKNDHADLGLPGGSVEPGETFDEAAVRETLEEVGVKILKMRDVFDHPCRVHYAHTFLAIEHEGEPRSMEGAWVGWVKPEALLEPHCSFREYNRALFEALDML